MAVRPIFIPRQDVKPWGLSSFNTSRLYNISTIRNPGHSSISQCQRRHFCPLKGEVAVELLKLGAPCG